MIQVNVNSVLTEPFELSHGAKQDCPLTDALYVLSISPLIRSIKSDGGIRLAYPDDLTVIIQEQSQPVVLSPHINVQISFIHFLPLYPVRGRGGLEPIPASWGKGRIHPGQVANLESPISLHAFGLWEPMRTWGEHANSAQKCLDLDLNLETSCCEATPLCHCAPLSRYQIKLKVLAFGSGKKSTVA